MLKLDDQNAIHYFKTEAYDLHKDQWYLVWGTFDAASKELEITGSDPDLYDTSNIFQMVYEEILDEYQGGI